jgi:hypothetical protein
VGNSSRNTEPVLGTSVILPGRAVKPRSRSGWG